MKKRICMLMTAVMVVSVLALAGCGGGSKPAETKAPQATEAVTEAAAETVKDETAENVSEEVAESVSVEPSEEASPLIADYTTIKEYLEDPEVKPQIEEIEKTNSNDQITMEVLAEGDNTLFYKCTFKEQYDAETADSIAQNLEAAMDDSMEAQMLDVKKTIEDASHITGLQIKMAYYLPDGTLLAERTYGGE